MESEGWCTAIILNYKRPQNIDILLRALLQTPGVGKVIVSNNNPNCDFRKWLSICHPRVRVMNPEDRRYCIERYCIALEDSAEYFLAVDDDLFLLPEQLHLLCERIRNNPAVPHGIFGEIHAEDGSIRYAVQEQDTEVDVLNRVYAFTKEHTYTFFSLVTEIGMGDRTTWGVCYWDDLVVSFCGSTKPLCHDVGPFLDCPTGNQEGIAFWRTSGFMERRIPVYAMLKDKKNKCEHRLVSVKENAPKVSVILSVRDGMPDVRESVESILHQTFDDFEFIITDDASTDGTSDVLRSYAEKDSRIVLLTNKENRGLAASCNTALTQARGTYIARMDADDVSFPRRLEQSVQYMDVHPETELLSCNWEWYSIPENRVLGQSIIENKPHCIAWYLLFFNYLSCHSAVLFRRRSAERLGFYNESLRCAVDYDLWVRMMCLGDMAVLPDVLVRFRRGREGSMSVIYGKEQRANAEHIAIHTFRECTGLNITSEKLHVLQSVCPIFWQNDSSLENRTAALSYLKDVIPLFVRWWSMSHLCDPQVVARDIRRCVTQ